MAQNEVRYRLTGDRALEGWLPESPETWSDVLVEVGLRYSYKSKDSIEVHFVLAGAHGPHASNEADTRRLIETKLAELDLSFEFLGVGSAREHEDERGILLSVTEQAQLERLVAKLAG